MILSLIEYKKENASKQVIVLVLGRKGNKLACILDETIDKQEAEIIKANTEKLAEYPLHHKITWMKKRVPTAYKNGYREFFLKNIIKVHRSYSMLSGSYVNNSRKVLSSP